MYSACLKLERVLSPGIGGDGKSTSTCTSVTVCDRAGIRLRGDGVT